MLTTSFYRGFFHILTVVVCILSIKTAQGVVFSRDMEDSEALAVRSKVLDIIKDRALFNEMLVIHLEKHRGSSREERIHILQEMYGDALSFSLNEEELSERQFCRDYEDYIEGARQDQQFYDFFDEVYMRGSLETIYKAASVALPNTENSKNMGKTLDERGFLRKIRSLLAPHITRDCYDLCERIRWVNGRNGAMLPISITQDQRFYLTRLGGKIDRYRNDVIRLGKKDQLEKIRKFKLLTDSVVEYIDKFTMLTDSWPNATRWERFEILFQGVTILEVLESSVETLESLRNKVVTPHSSQKASPPLKDPRIQTTRNKKSPPALKANEASSSDSGTTSTSSTTSTSTVAASSSAAATTAEITLTPLLEEIGLEQASEGSKEEGIREPALRSLEESVPEQVSGRSDASSSQINRKPKITKESYTERNRRQKINRQNFIERVKREQPMEEMVELVESRTSLLDSKSLERLRKFIGNTYKYKHTSFAAWIKKLNNERDGMDSEGGSQWTVSLFDSNGDDHSASIHTLHTKRFKRLDPVSRSNMLFLLEAAGFIKWNR